MSHLVEGELSVVIVPRTHLCCGLTAALLLLSWPLQLLRCWRLPECLLQTRPPGCS